MRENGVFESEIRGSGESLSSTQPLVIVQSTVGHMSPEMTKHYMAHSTMEAKREFMALMSDFTGGAAEVQTSSCSNSNIREELNTLLDQLSLFSLRRVLDFARGLL